MATQPTQVSRRSDAYPDNRNLSLQQDNSTTQIGSGNSFSLDLSSGSYSPSYTYITATDHGAVEKAFKTVQKAQEEAFRSIEKAQEGAFRTTEKALECMQNVAMTALMANDESTSQLMNSHRAQLREMQESVEMSLQHTREVVTESQRRELATNSAIWKMLPNLNSGAISEFTKMMIERDTQSLNRIEEAERRNLANINAAALRKTTIEHSRIDQINSAIIALEQIAFDFARQARNTKLLLMVCIIVPLTSASIDVRVTIAVGYITLQFLANSLLPALNKIQSKRKLVNIYKSSLELLEADPDLTIRNAVRQKIGDDLLLLQIPNVLVIGNTSEYRSEMSHGLQTFVNSAR